MIQTHDQDQPLVTLAGEAKCASEACRALPEVRLGKVMDMRRRIALGLFHPSAGDLADAILASAARSLLCH